MQTNFWLSSKGKSSALSTDTTGRRVAMGMGGPITGLAPWTWRSPVVVGSKTATASRKVGPRPPARSTPAQLILKLERSPNFLRRDFQPNKMRSPIPPVWKKNLWSLGLST